MENFFVELGTLLNTTPENVKAVVTSNDEAKALSLITEFKANNKVYNNTDLEAYTNNVKNNYVSELANLAKEGKAPQELHSVIKGSVLEQTTKKLAEKWGITEPVKSIEELYEKAVKTDVSAANYKTELDEYKMQHQTIISDYERKLSEEQKRVDGELSRLDINNTLNALKFEVEEDKQQMQRELLDAAVSKKYAIKWDAEKKRNVVFEGEKMLKHDKTLEPIAPIEIYKQVAQAYGLPIAKPKPDGRGEPDAGQSTSGLTKQQWIEKRMGDNQKQFGNSNLTAADYKEMNEKFKN
jgi:hypothetical protein